MATIASLYVSLSLQAENFNNGLKAAQKEAKEFGKTVAPTTKLLDDMGTAMTAAGAGLTAAVTVPLAAIGGLSVKAATEFESSFAGVRKTVDATEQEFAALSEGFREMSKNIPVSVNELNKIGEAAGQLGIKKEDILQFTRVMADLGVATNLTADQAATATGQFQNIFGAAGKDVDRFGATLVALGNAGASTEKDIIDMGLRIAGAAQQIGLTQAQTLSFASALSSVGINAEAGGSAISRVFLKINDAVAKGGEGLDEFARIAGVSSAAFKASFETDAAGATVEFIKGLNRIKSEGENVNATLEGVVGKNIILKDTLMRAAGAGDMLSQTLKLGDQAWQDNTALVKEAEQRYKTFESQFQVFKNQANDVAITLGTALLPILKDLLTSARPIIEVLADAAKWFSELPAPVRTVTVVIAGLAAALGPVLVALGFIASSIASLIPVFTSLSAVIGGTAGLSAILGALSGAVSAVVAVLTGPVGIVVAIVAATAALSKFVMNNETLVKLLDPVWNAIGGLINTTVDFIIKLWDGMWKLIIDAPKRAKDAILGAVKGVTDGVTGFFAGMYDAVVGHSYVPDMIDRIAQEFARLPGVMEAPVLRSTKSVMDSFSSMFNTVSSGSSSWAEKAGSIFDFGGGTMKGLAKDTASPLWKVGGALAGLAGPIGIGWSLGSSIAGLLGIGGPSEEEKQAEAARNRFAALQNANSINDAAMQRAQANNAASFAGGATSSFSGGDVSSKLDRIIALLERGGVVQMDGQPVGRVLAPIFNRLRLDEGLSY